MIFTSDLIPFLILKVYGLLLEKYSNYRDGSSHMSQLYYILIKGNVIFKMYDNSQWDLTYFFASYFQKR